MSASGKGSKESGNAATGKMTAEGTTEAAVQAGSGGSSEQPQMQQQQAQHREANQDVHHEKAVRTAVIVIVVVIALGLLFANLATKYLKSSPEKNLERHYYNGFEFVKRGNFWYTEWERQDGTNYSIEFRNSPWDVENITVSGTVDDRFKLWPHILLTHDPTNETTKSTSFVVLSAFNIARVLTAVFEKDVIAACSANVTEACATRPIATCSTNASVVYLKVANETGIFLDGNCAVIQGSEENLTKAADKAIYQWLGIIRR